MLGVLGVVEMKKHLARRPLELLRLREKRLEVVTGASQGRTTSSLHAT